MDPRIIETVEKISFNLQVLSALWERASVIEDSALSAKYPFALDLDEQLSRVQAWAHDIKAKAAQLKTYAAVNAQGKPTRVTIPE